MEEIGKQLVITFMVVFVIFVGPFTAIGLLLRRKKVAHAARRSPLTADLLRSAGHTLREKLEDLRWDFAFDLSLLMVMPSMLLAMYLLQLQFRSTAPALWLNVVFVLVGVGFILYAIRSSLRRATEMDKLRKGLDAEVAVGQELDQLMRQGAAVFHDFPADKFNIDHVVIAPEGVFAVETKGYTKPVGDGHDTARVEFDGHTLTFPDWMTTKPIEHAERRAQWLAKWLASATGEPIPVLPILALPGWFVERNGSGPVRVFSGRALHSLLKVGTPGALSPQDMRRAIHQIDQRCRNVKPTWRPNDESEK